MRQKTFVKIMFAAFIVFAGLSSYAQTAADQGIIPYLDTEVRGVWAPLVTKDGNMQLTDEIAAVIGVSGGSVLPAVIYGNRMFLFRDESGMRHFEGKLPAGRTLNKDNMMSVRIEDDLTIDSKYLPGNMVFHNGDLLIALNNNIIEIIYSNNAIGMIGFNGVIAYFATDVYTLSPADKAAIKVLAGKLKNSVYSKILVDGHTDSTGSRAHNQTLSVRRAQSVANELVKNGIPRSKISVTGHNFSMPAATNTTRAGRALNRRTEITIK